MVLLGWSIEDMTVLVSANVFDKQPLVMMY